MSPFSLYIATVALSTLLRAALLNQILRLDDITIPTAFLRLQKSLHAFPPTFFLAHTGCRPSSFLSGLPPVFLALIPVVASFGKPAGAPSQAATALGAVTQAYQLQMRRSLFHDCRHTKNLQFVHSARFLQLGTLPNTNSSILPKRKTGRANLGYIRVKGLVIPKPYMPVIKYCV